MKRRTCPKCNEVLGEYDYFFCSACGEKLPEELVRKPRSIRIKTYKLEDAAKKSLPPFVKKLKNRKVLYSAGLVAFIGLVLFGIYTTGIFDLLLMQKPSQTEVVEVPTKTQEQSNIIVTDEETNLQPGDFSNTELSTYYPADTAFYFEAFDLTNFSSYFADVEGLSEIFSRSQILFENNFVGGYLEEPETWVFVFKLKDKGLVETLIEDVENENWNLEIYEDVLLMVQDEEAFALVEDVETKVTASLALDPKYVSQEKDLPNDGSIKIIIMDEQIKDDFNQYFEVLNEDISSILTTVLNSEETGFLVK